MLTQLRIKNIALIDELTVNFTEGMNCMTGETGAGKSIIIDAISCMLGGRASKDIIKSGCESAFAEGVFYEESVEVKEFLNEIGIEPEEDGTLILQREISSSGRNVCRVNGRLVATSALKQLGDFLIDIHGQNDNRLLIKTSSHVNLLDAYGGEEISIIKKNFLSLLKEFKDLHSSLKDYSGDPAERERLADLLRFQIEEIDNADLYEGEDDELLEKRNVLLNSEKISESLNNSKIFLKGSEYADDVSVCDLLSSVKASLSSIADYSSQYADVLSRLEEASYIIEDVSDDLRGLAENVYFDKNELEKTEERINEINKLKRKYGATINEIIIFANNTKEQLDKLMSAEDKVNEILAKLDSYNEELRNLCEDLNFMRVKVAKHLSENIMAELASLEMSKTKFETDIVFFDEKDEKGYYKFTNEGLDNVEFLISANPGEPLKPLSKIASGGELSRIMLAIKTILADADETSTLIFDEIDTGISGIAAKSVAQKLKSISSKHQVICVTHHAQIAAAADNNIFISKQFENNNTVTSIKNLNEIEKIKEVSRLLDGDSESEITAVHAKELIAKFRSN